VTSALTVIILTYNEEKNIAQSLRSVCHWAEQVFVLDSYSSDETCAIAETFACTVVQHTFEGYPQQRNWALEHLPITTEWVFFLDADEWVTEELKQEISELLTTNPIENGFYIKRRLLWRGQWIKRGYYPTWLLRLFRHGKGRCEERQINEHFVIDGEAGHLQHDFVHEDQRGIDHWIQKHNQYATKEAEELLKVKNQTGYADARFWGTQAERKRWLRCYVWNRLPVLVRPFVYFFYRFILKGGFLDGKQAFIYHFFQGLWFPLLIDVKYLEMREHRNQQQSEHL
jgi:glycosyltransferase involved in cell wall biosynthesis